MVRTGFDREDAREPDRGLRAGAFESTEREEFEQRLIDEVRTIAVYPVETEPVVERYIREHGAELHEFARKIRERHFRQAV